MHTNPIDKQQSKGDQNLAFEFWQLQHILVAVLYHLDNVLT